MLSDECILELNSFIKGIMDETCLTFSFSHFFLTEEC